MISQVKYHKQVMRAIGSDYLNQQTKKKKRPKRDVFFSINMRITIVLKIGQVARRKPGDQKRM